MHLRDTYELKFSFDNRLLSEYFLSLDRDFINPDEALKFLIKDLPLNFEKNNGVFIIYPDKPGEDPKHSAPTILTGIISDAFSGETLPYSHLTINNQHIISDAQGRFSHKSKEDTAFIIQATYLGYYNLDSLVFYGGEHMLFMNPSSIDLEEIVIEDKSIKLSTMSSFNPGEMRLNRKIGSYLPGFADNSLYNLLRLQPGVLAAGEQSNDLININTNCE